MHETLCLDLTETGTSPDLFVALFLASSLDTKCWRCKLFLSFPVWPNDYMYVCLQHRESSWSLCHLHWSSPTWVYCAFISFVSSSEWGKEASLHPEFPQHTARVQIIHASNKKIQNQSATPDLSISFVMPYTVNNSSAIIYWFLQHLCMAVILS